MAFLKSICMLHFKDEGFFVRFGLPVLIVLVGFGFLGLGAGKLYLNQLYTQEGKQTLGTVTYYTSRPTPRSISSLTEYQFATSDGMQIKGNQEGYYTHIGEQVKTEYLPDAPQWNRFAGAGRRNEGWNISMAVGGLLFFVAGIYAVIRTARRG